LRLFKFILCLIILAPAVLFAGVTEQTLENGIKVLVVEDHKSPIAIFQIWYRVGAGDEDSGSAGISHLLEHMMFKGTPTFGSKVLSRTVQRYGGTDNAFTSKDYTAYFQTLPSDRIDLSVEFESDRMQNLILDPEDTLSERSVVMEERRLRYEDSPRNMLYEETVAAAFKVHPYRRPVIGWMSSLRNIQREDLLRHYREFYSPENAFIVVVGDVETDETLRKINATFSKIEAAGPARLSQTPEEPPQKGERRVHLKRKAELPYILALYHVPSLPDEDSYALEVLATVLSGGKSSRLYKSLVYKDNIAISAFAEYNGTMKDPYLFILGGTAAPGISSDEVEEALYAEIDAVKDKGPSEFELKKAKNQLEADFIMSQDSLFYQAMLLGIFEILGDWKLRDIYIDEIQKVTADDVIRVANKYLHQDNRTVGVLVPEKK
jgi:zinc protease